MEQINHSYAIGQRVTSKVERLLPYGILVRLRDGTRGYIRRRELSQAGDVEPGLLVHEGQQIEAIVLMLPHADRMMELSLRATLPDPWEGFINACRVGDVVAGTVKQLMPRGVYVEILPGVNGFVGLADLATWKVDRAEDVLWTDDDIEAVVTRIDGNTRKVGLSIRLRMRQVFHDVAPTELGQRVDTDAVGNQDTFAQVELELETKDELAAQEQSAAPGTSKHIGQILVVDDEIAEPLVVWLRRHGYEADAARTAEEALERIHRQSYAICLVDLELPGMDGLTLIRRIRAEGTKVPIAVISVAEWLADRANEIEELGVTDVLAKPLDLDEVERLLVAIEQNKPLTRWRGTPTLHQRVKPEPFQDLLTAADSGASLIDQLRAGLAQLVEITRAEVGVVFRIDPTSQAITIECDQNPWDGIRLPSEGPALRVMLPQVQPHTIVDVAAVDETANTYPNRR